MADYTRRVNLDMFTTLERMGMDDLSEAFFHWLSLEDTERQRKYRSYRDYYNGDQEVMLTERQKQFLELKPHQHFSANYCQLVVDELARRMTVRGFEAGPQQGGLDGKLWEWWQWGRMDAKQKSVHASAVRDGDTYVIVGWDWEKGRPTYHHNMAYDGNEGVKVHYDDETGEISFASKRWMVYRDGDIYRRINLYYDDHIERYISSDRLSNGVWSPFTGDGLDAVIPWINRAGQPLGVPVIHFAYNAAGWRWGMSVLEQVIPLQNALNKSIVDLVAAADSTGFRVYFGSGIEGEDEDGNELLIAPGTLITTRNENGRLMAIPGEDLRPLIEVVDAFKIAIAQVTETPLHLFQVSGQNASEGAQKQQEVGMILRADDAAVHFGNSWEDVMYLSRRVHNAFSNEPAVAEDTLINALWKDFEVRDRVERVREMAEAMAQIVSAGGDLEAAARFAGVDEENAAKIAAFSVPAGMIPPATNETPDPTE